MGVAAQAPVDRLYQQTLSDVSQVEASVHAGMINQCHVVTLHSLPSSGRVIRGHLLSGPGSQRKRQPSGKTRPHRMTTI